VLAVVAVVLLLGAGWLFKDVVLTKWHLAQLESPDASARSSESSARALGQLGAPDAIRPLVGKLARPDAWRMPPSEATRLWFSEEFREVSDLREVVRERIYLEALLEIVEQRGRATVPHFLNLLEVGDSLTCYVALRFLGKLAPHEAVTNEAIRKLLQHHDGGVRDAAADVLARTEPPPEG
jgi:HEAT repeat protein